MGSVGGPEIAIVGGGIAGLTLAIALYHRGVNIKIYEQAAHFREIGAGVSFSPNAVEAMHICHSGVHDAFKKVCTTNMWKSKKNVWFDYYNGYHDIGEPKHADAAFTITNKLGQNGVHRANFLDELVKLLPQRLTAFGKRLDDITKTEDGRLSLNFVDGSKATADAVIGCDGIKSRVRRIMFGSEHPCAHPSYTHKYAYRAMVAMKDAVGVVGEEQAENACMHVSLLLPI